MKGKAGKIAVLVSVAALLMTLPLAFAGLYGDSEGIAVTTASVTNALPSIQAGSVVVDTDDDGTPGAPWQVDPMAGTTRTVLAHATGVDANGGADITGVRCWFNTTGVSYGPIAGTLDAPTGNANTRTVRCEQAIDFDDPYGTWTVEFEVEDEALTWSDPVSGEFEYLRVAYIDLSGAATVSWAALVPDADDAESSNVVLIDNVGNSIIDLFVKGGDLNGVTDPTWEIPISAVSVDTETGQTEDQQPYGGDNAYDAWVAGANLQVEGDPENGDIDMYHYMDVPTPLMDQSYSGTITVCAAIDEEVCA